jgi:glycosyltransferase involved in cell wall biosynthesis
MTRLVSCILPTFNRRRFVAQAIRHFQRQDYTERELIVVDDGTDPVEDLAGGDPRIRYIRLDRRLTVGAKRNLACREARGEIIVHWDDDDWMADWRVSYQVKRLEESRAEICGLDRLWYWQPDAGKAWEYVYPAAAHSNKCHSWSWGSHCPHAPCRQ